MEFKGVVFDMDGLMFDTESPTMDAWVYAGEQLGWPIDRELALMTIGLDARDTRRFFEKHFGDKFDYEAIRDTMRRYYINNLNTGSPRKKPGLDELLEYIAGRGLKIGLATSARHERAINHIEKAGLSDYFQIVVGGDMVNRSKPAPDVYIEACRRLELAPKDVLAVEDSPAGAKAAFDAGMSVALVPDLIAPDAKTQALLWAECKQLDEIICLLETGG